jgi:membrane protein implicated in regulation of membrane protease activity
MSSTRLAVLFVSALAGLLVVLGLALAPLGWVVETAYLLLVVTGLVLLGRKARALRQAKDSHDDGRTCRCCTTTVYDPVEIR